MSYKQTLVPGLWLATLLIDRLTKWFVMHYISAPYPITSWMSIEKALNRGVVWGILGSANTAIFLAVSLVAIGCYLSVSYFLLSFARSNYEVVGGALILAGGLSNIIDRFWYHGVVDFIACSYAGYNWPIFNIADMAIVIGAALIFLHMMRE